jgi:hypothetical protein
MLAPEQTRQRLFARLDHDAFPHPLPELSLCRPKLFPIPADHERRFLFLFLLSAHSDTPLPLRVVDTQGPRGEASLARQQLVVKTYGQNSPSRSYDLETYRRVFDSATNGSEWELGSVLTLGNSLRNINVSVNHSRRRNVGDAPRNSKGPSSELKLSLVSKLFEVHRETN